MRTALVIGAASGIGHGIADVLNTKGVHVIQADISFSEDTQNTSIRHVDATDEKSITSLTNFLHEESICIDYLIITIGAIDEGSATDYPEQSLSWMLNINLLAPYRLIQHLIPSLRNSDSPKILLTGSGAGLGFLNDQHNLLPYIVSKHALMGYFKVLRQELTKQDIQVSLLLPNRVAGKLSENSAKMRNTFLHESDEEAKGLQTLNVNLVEPYEVALEFIEQFLNGRTYISNNPRMIIDKLQDELNEIQDDFLPE